MAEIDTDQAFGIEKTMSMDTGGAGDANLLNDLFAPETSTANPDDVTAIDNDGGSKKGPDGKADPTQLAGGEDDVPATKASDPEALTNFLLGNDDDDDDPDAVGDDDDDTDDDAAAQDTADDTADDDGDDDDDAEDTKKSDGIIAFDSLANELADLGVFTRQEGEEEGIPIESPEDFLDRFNAEKQRGAQEILSNFLGQFGKEHQDAFDAIYVNGANPREYFSQAAKVEDFTNLDLSKEANQESVVRQTLLDQGFEPEDIDNEIEKIKNYGDLEDVSKRHHKVLVKKEQATLKQREAQAAQTLKIKQEQKALYVDNVRATLTEKLKAKEFDGIPLNTQTANELQDFLLVDKWKTESGETLTDFDKAILEMKRPENHATKVKLGLLLKLLEKDPTLSTIQKRGVSKKTSQLFKDVARQKTSATRAEANKKQPTKSWFQ